MTVSWCGIDVELRSMATAPMDGTGILVLLESSSLSRVWHTATLRSNVSIVGHLFAFDCPKMIGWLPLPTESQTVEEVR